MELIYLKRDQIDTEKWNQLVNENPKVSVSNFTWFLDIISEKWGAYKAKNEDIYFPLPYLSGVKNKMLYQPIFSRVLSVVASSEANIQNFIGQLKERIPKDFKHYWFHADFPMQSNSTERIYQKIEPLDGLESIRSNYSTNAKRQIKKYAESDSELLINSNISEGVDLIKKVLGEKIPELKNEQFEILKKLVTTSMKENGGFLINLTQKSNIKAAAFFIKRDRDLVFIKGAAHEDELKKGAMYGLMDQSFEHFSEQITTIDFDGSNIESVAEFYKRLGGKDHIYFENKNTQKIPIQYSIIKNLF